MLNKMFLKNKKAQLSETMVWVVATIIVIVALSIFIFISIKIAEVKKVDVQDFISIDSGNLNRFESKTQFAYSLNNENKELIEGWISNE